MKLKTLILGLLLVTFIGQFAFADEPDKPNILFIAVDDLNDWAGYRGHTEVITPNICLLYTSPSPRDRTRSRMPSSA